LKEHILERQQIVINRQTADETNIKEEKNEKDGVREEKRGCEVCA